MDVKELVLHELDQLGKCADEVAENLYRYKIRGTQGSCFNCPIVNFIKSKIQMRFSVVSASQSIIMFAHVKVDNGAEISEMETIEPPPAVAWFISNFDSAQYGFLRA